MKRIIFIAVIGILCAGCRLHPPQAYQPSTPAVLSLAYTVQQFQDDQKQYTDAYNAGDFAKAKMARDRFGWDMEQVINNNYHVYANGLSALRSTAGFGSDVLQSGIAGAGTLMGGIAMKQLLDVALLGVQGTERSAKARYFADVPVTTFKAAMDSQRAAFLTKIESSLAKPVQDYPFQQLRADLTELFYAGTLPSAQEFLAKQAVTGGK